MGRNKIEFFSLKTQKIKIKMKEATAPTFHKVKLHEGFLTNFLWRNRFFKINKKDIVDPSVLWSLIFRVLTKFLSAALL